MRMFSNLRKNKRARQAQTHASPTYLLNEKSPFNLTEAFRDLKMRVSVSVPKSSGGTVIAMTSAFPNEGKTTVAANLALMFAYSNAKVLLIDADIRKGRIHKFFGGSSKGGLSEYLSSQMKKEEVIRPSGVADNLFYIACGTHSPRPFELLESKEMQNFLQELREEYDYILVDAPPVLIVSDVLAVAPSVDGVVFVCRHESSYMGDISRALSSLKFANANVLGVVVNDYDPKAHDLGKGYKNYSYSNYQYAYADEPPTTADEPLANDESKK